MDGDPLNKNYVLETSDDSIMFSPHGFDSSEKKNKKPIVYKHYIRKFPGPAGLSPDLPHGDVEKLVSEETGFKGISNNGILLGSTYSNILLKKPCYQKLIQDYGLNESNNPINQLTLQVVSKAFIRKAKKDMKVPFLGLLVSSISLEHGVSLKLMDSTHEVNAVIHQNVWEEICDYIKVNSAIALMQVPVIASCTIRPPITLFISRKNLLSIYIETDDAQMEVKSFNFFSESELKKTCSEWLNLMGMNPFGKASPLRSSATRSTSDQNSKANVSSSCDKTISKFKWTSDDDFFNDLDLSIDDFGNSCGQTTSTLSNRNLTAVASENFTSKRPKFDFGLSSSKSSSFFSKQDSGFCSHQFSSLKDSQSPLQMDSSQTQDLSQSEKLMVQEVLNGITFDDFDC